MNGDGPASDHGPSLGALPAETPEEVAPPKDVKKPGMLITVWRVMRANPLTAFGFILVILICAAAFLIWFVPTVTGPLGHSISILPYDPNAQSSIGATPPSAAHWFGTDQIGLDIFSRVMAALPLDLGIGVGIATLSLFVGGFLGLVAGFWDRPGTAGGLVSVVILRLTDIFLAFPSLLLALAISASLGKTLTATIIAVSLTWWPYYVRVTRGEVLSVRHQPYIMAARSAGVSEFRILARHVVRNILEPLIVYFTLDVGTVIVTFSTISFIGISLPPNVPEWGTMVSYYTNLVSISTQWWVIAGPGLAIFVTVLAFSLVGDGMRDLLDPRSRRVLAEAQSISAGAPSSRSE
jgi:peptide/nickel transport system permease protein